MGDLVSIRTLWELLQSGLRLGALPQGAYLLGCHVLHHMVVAYSRTCTMSLRDMTGTVLLEPASSLVLAGDLSTGLRLASPEVGRTHASIEYTVALQKLHWSRVVFSALHHDEFTRDGYEDMHFTMHPRLRSGPNWNDFYPVIYRLPNTSIEDTVAAFSAFFGIPSAPAKMNASFL